MDFEVNLGSCHDSRHIPAFKHSLGPYQPVLRQYLSAAAIGEQRALKFNKAGRLSGEGRQKIVRKPHRQSAEALLRLPRSTRSDHEDLSLAN